jgi:hypothetical protein
MMPTLKLFLLLVFCMSCTSALVVPSSSGRRTFLTKAVPATAAAALIAVATATPAFADDSEEYQFYVAKPVAEKKSNNSGGLAVGGVLAGGFALSLPFFLPNLLRLAGVKNAKNPSTGNAKNNSNAKKNTKKR